MRHKPFRGDRGQIEAQMLATLSGQRARDTQFALDAAAEEFASAPGAFRYANGEAVRVAAVRAQGAVPDSCGPEIPHAPARGPLHAFQPTEIMPGGSIHRNAGYLGRDAARVGDVFDVMTDQARRAHKGSKSKDQPFVPPFTAGQVTIARDYAALDQRVKSAGIRCSSIEALRAATPGGGGEWIDAVIHDSQRLAVLHRRIGDGLAKEVRRVRPDERRRAIQLRALVDQVCLGDMPLDGVLRGHGWNINAKVRNALRDALRGALDRMQGYSGDMVQDVA